MPLAVAANYAVDVEPALTREFAPRDPEMDPDRVARRRRTLYDRAGGSLSAALRPHGPDRADRSRPLLRRRRLPYRSVAAGSRARRSPMRTPITPASARISMSAIADRADPQETPRRRRDRDRGLRRGPDPQRRRDLAPPGRPCAGLRAGPRGASRRSLGRVGRLQDSRPTASSPPSSRSAATSLSPKSTFGLPIYRWRPQAEIMAAIDAWWRENAAAGRASVLYAYALGKAQRVLAHVDASIGPIVCHGAVEPINAIYREAGVALPPTRLAERDRGQARFRRRADRRAAVGRGEPLAQAVRRLFRRAGERLDAGPRQPPPARPRPRLRAVRSRRLAGAPRRDRGDRRGTGARDPRLGRRR